MELIGKVNEEGHIVPTNIQEIKEDLKIAFGDKDIEISIKKHRRSRSGRQNRWYWGVAVPTVQSGIKEQTGIVYDKDTIHALILNSVGAISMETKNIMGMNVIEVKQKRTSDMSVEEFSEFFMLIQQHFAEKGIDIPEPIQDNFYNQMK